jgi:hypothetical protein
MTINEFRMLKFALSRDFMSFTDRGVRELNQGGSFSHNWHLDAVAWQLKKVISGETKRLINPSPISKISHGIGAISSILARTRSP